jgi:molybdopterin molybdotransferase
MTDRRSAGFHSLTPLSAARERLCEAVTPHGRTATVALTSAPGRVLATAVTADRDVPHYDRAAMDGYAVRAADTHGAGDRSPAVLDVTRSTVTDSGADVTDPDAADSDADAADPDTDETATVDQRTAVGVHTGSELPDGADAVVKLERVERVDGAVEVFEPVAAGENVAAAGEDVAAGATLFEAGHRLRASDLALLKTVGVDAVECYERPTVGVVPTGEELVQRDPDPGEVVETNGLTVSQLVERWGGRATYRDVVGDDPATLRAAVQRDLTKDIVVTTGGSSVGDRDRVAEVVADLGEELVHGVAVTPGHPFGVGVVADTPVLMLPGYPVACLVTAVQFLRPALKQCGHLPPADHPETTAVLDRKLPSEVGVRTFARVRLAESGAVTDDGDDSPGEPAPADAADASSLPVAEPVHTSGAGVMSSVSDADGWVVVPESSEGIPAGDRVTVQDWEWSP